jgi:hypothetical protein
LAAVPLALALDAARAAHKLLGLLVVELLGDCALDPVGERGALGESKVLAAEGLEMDRMTALRRLGTRRTLVGHDWRAHTDARSATR